MTDPHAAWRSGICGMRHRRVMLCVSRGIEE